MSTTNTTFTTISASSTIMDELVLRMSFLSLRKTKRGEDNDQFSLDESALKHRKIMFTVHTRHYGSTIALRLPSETRKRHGEDEDGDEEKPPVKNSKAFRAPGSVVRLIRPLPRRFVKALDPVTIIFHTTERERAALNSWNARCLAAGASMHADSFLEYEAGMGSTDASDTPSPATSPSGINSWNARCLAMGTSMHADSSDTGDTLRTTASLSEIRPECSNIRFAIAAQEDVELFEVKSPSSATSRSLQLASFENLVPSPMFIPHTPMSEKANGRQRAIDPLSTASMDVAKDIDAGLVLRDATNKDIDAGPVLRDATNRVSPRSADHLRPSKLGGVKRTTQTPSGGENVPFILSSRRNFIMKSRFSAKNL